MMANIQNWCLEHQTTACNCPDRVAKPTPAECKHPFFRSSVHVFRHTAPDGEKVVGYSAEVYVRCIDCDMPMLFMGCPAGSSPQYPTCSVDRQELRVPLEPSA